MKIKKLIRGIPHFQIKHLCDSEVRGLSSDSRLVAPGDLFIARKGEKYDGSHYIAKALESGAVAICTDLYDPTLKYPQLIHEDPAAVEGFLAANFYKQPSREIPVIGITGSKGKTTTVYLIQHLLKPCGFLSTIEAGLGKEKQPSSFTTHEAIYNHKVLREMIHQGCHAAVLEVSSIGLSLHRTVGIEFEVAVFTNLFPDHLDFHRDLQDYAFSKKKLFQQAKKGIFNADSPWKEFMQEGFKGEKMTFGIDFPADVTAQDLSFSYEKANFTLTAGGQRACVHSHLLGKHNVYNLLSAAAVGLQRGLSLPFIAEKLSQFDYVPGRLEKICNARGLHVFIDYAHTQEALENTLKTLRPLSSGRLLVLFGCGGNRDAARRTGMAQAAESWGDLSVITSDNPRQEDPQEIIRQILSGFTSLKNVFIEPDRKKAIHWILQKAKKGDVVVIAGKGHEKTQIVGNQTFPFDDCAVAREALT